MSVLFVVNVALFLVFLLFGVASFTPRSGTVRHAKDKSRSNRTLHLAAALLLCLLAGRTTCAAQEPAMAGPITAPPSAKAAASLLTNAEIIEMVKAGFAEETILKSIQLSETRFDTSVAALVELKNAGVNEKVIQAMLSPKVVKTESAPLPAKNPLVPDDVGVYYIQNDQLKDVRPELVGWRSGGVGKSLLLGTKGHINGALKGPQSQNIVATPVEFVVRCPETLEIEEYQLLRLDEKPDRREFRALTGGYIHSSSGLDKNALKFEFVKIAPRVYRLKLGNLPKGEYGLLPPGGSFGAIGGGASGAMIMQGSASAGKVYSFRVIE